MKAQVGGTPSREDEVKPLVITGTSVTSDGLLSSRMATALRFFGRMLHDPLWVAIWLFVLFCGGLLGTSPLRYPLLNECTAEMEVEADSMALHHDASTAHQVYRPGDLGMFVAGISAGAVLIMVSIM